ncbi:Bestrophin, RFP-TM, chloride channel-domain-containing protein [Lentinula lateritia]|uniref:Bestrophin, RFP-TM, chloride channel-domain-containing protein n=1 Tax=Lentinula lateritia TaxID=40482 RepID=A0ABQ8W2C3_9AGAR|nr:Bestrophin, RFP-TM, chloride channel-domain-containing protein [Lentinula lateritia]
METNPVSRLHGKRSFTGKHNLLPATQPIVPLSNEARESTIEVAFFTFGRGSIWKIWPAVLFYTIFSTGKFYALDRESRFLIHISYPVIVVLEEKAKIRSLAIPNVLLTVLGVVIGFVISYRAMSGYDRYWLGRSIWSDLIRNSRTMGRFVWYHVPPRLTPKTDAEIASGQLDRSHEELVKVMAEKRMALDLIEGELGIYFEDLYHLVRPLHDHEHTIGPSNTALSSALPTATKVRRIASNPALPHPIGKPINKDKGKSIQYLGDPIIPPINAYGTFSNDSSPPNGPRRSLRHISSTSSLSNESVRSEHQALHPSQNPNAHKKITHVDPDLIPFSGVFHNIKEWLKGQYSSSSSYTQVQTSNDIWGDTLGFDASQRKWSGPIRQRFGKAKHGRSYPEVRGENLPLEILRCFSEWCSVLEERNTVPGTSLGSLIGCVAAMEDSLGALERILTTPLPFVYSVHIRTVWIYLFFLPFQLIDQFLWYTIPGTTIAAFIYLGFLAAGEEIEQPFGYDDNDLDLDMFCQEIIHVDIENLKRTPCLNAYLPQAHKLAHKHSMTVTEVADVDPETK